MKKEQVKPKILTASDIKNLAGHSCNGECGCNCGRAYSKETGDVVLMRGGYIGRAPQCKCFPPPVAPAPTASAEESKDKILNVKFVNEVQMIWGGLERAIKMIRKLHPKCEGGAWCACKICSDSDLMAAEFISESFTKSELSAYASSQSEKLRGVGQQAAEEIAAMYDLKGMIDDAAAIIDRVIAGRVKP